MNAALALIFFVCVAGSMASDARSQILGQFVQQGQVVAQTVLAQLQQQIMGFVQQAVGQLSALVGASFGRFDFSALLTQFQPLVQGLINQALGQIVGGLTGLIGGRGAFDLGAIFSGFLQQITTPLTQIGQHFLNQGLAAVLGGLSGSRGISDIFAALQQQISSAAAIAQGVISGAVGNISAIGSSLLDASKPHWEQLQEQLVGHGLNVLGSLSETINNLHGSITGGN